MGFLAMQLSTDMENVDFAALEKASQDSMEKDVGDNGQEGSIRAGNSNGVVGGQAGEQAGAGSEAGAGAGAGKAAEEEAPLEAGAGSGSGF